jgi:hypothetical protein
MFLNSLLPLKRKICKDARRKILLKGQFALLSHRFSESKRKLERERRKPLQDPGSTELYFGTTAFTIHSALRRKVEVPQRKEDRGKL